VPAPFRIERLADFPQYVDVIAGWQHAEFGYLDPMQALDERRAKLAESLCAGGVATTLIALTADGTPVGSASLQSKTLVLPNLSPWLSMVVTREPLRGRGIASALSLAVVAEAKRLNFETIYLFTLEQESLYRRLGWKTIGAARIVERFAVVMSRPTELMSRGRFGIGSD
jgi:predicted N-acetyltransferase YhbS